MHPDLNPCGSVTPLFTRRDVLKTFSCGFGWLAFAGLAQRETFAARWRRRVRSARRAAHLPARAKRVIFLTMRGGPSHVDTFDYKPQLTADTGKPGKRPGTKLLGSKWKFAQAGRAGCGFRSSFRMWPSTPMSCASCARCRPICRAHPQAFLKLHTGSSQFVRPSLGAWTLYGLGTANENLPGFITLTPPSGFGGAQNYGSAFLPAHLSGDAHRLGEPADRRCGGAQSRDASSARPRSARNSNLIQTLNREKLARDRVNPEVEGVIESYELAFKMQSEMPQVMDLSKETEATKKLYGIGRARRRRTLAGSACSRGASSRRACASWKSRTATGTSISTSPTRWRTTAARSISRSPACSRTCERAACSKDTLVVWAGEFGRTPHAQGGDGRDHNNKAFTMWMAGGGVKGGIRLRPDGRLRLRGRSKTKCRSTTCTRRSSRCSASITKSSPIATPAAISASRTWREMWCVSSFRLNQRRDQRVATVSG